MINQKSNNFPNKPQKTSFWDFKSVKVYTDLGEKILDFVIGFIIGGIILNFTPCYFLTRLASLRYKQLIEIGREMPTFPIREILLILMIYVALILVILYLLKRRRHFALGFLIPLISSILGFILLLL